MRIKEQLIKNLNHYSAKKRLDSLKGLKKLEKTDPTLIPVKLINDANNHIHTTYSFSPYSPSKAAYMAYTAGLTTLGIMDHDSISGAKEFLKACKILGICPTVGFEMRVKMQIAGMGEVLINNPDQKNCAYMAVHGVPHQNFLKVSEFIKPYREARAARNQKMVEKINTVFSKYALSINYKRDVLPLSMSKEDGAVTERHLLFALSKKLIKKYGKGEKTVEFLTNELNIVLPEKLKERLENKENIYYEYDLLGALKSDSAFFYIPADEELCDLDTLSAFSGKIGAILAYSYLGDIGVSVTGDKKANKFEDGYLDKLFETISAANVKAVAYMPTRNSSEQLKRIQTLCSEYQMMEISGEDINSPRQKFECEKLKEEQFKGLITSTYALIGHEYASSINIEDGFFSQKTIEKIPKLKKRIEVYAAIGRNLENID